MTNKLSALALTTMLIGSFSSVHAKTQVKTGDAAPTFTAVGHDGKTYKLSDLKGKTVVLEWYNDGCPYVKKHYNEGHMQKLQKEYMDKGVQWFSVISSKPGSQGAVVSPEEAAKLRGSRAASSVTLLDTKGDIGKAYGATTTPHMFVINAEGKLVYQGAIDDQPSANKKTLVGAKNHVREALDQVLSKKTVTLAETTPYGCSVKY